MSRPVPNWIIAREQDVERVSFLIDSFPVTAIVGPRQCGKTTLAKQLPGEHYFDLENPRDLARLEQPQIILESLSGLIVIDEVQQMPGLFPLIRYLVDEDSSKRFLILGSASPSLVRRSSETLAGRIGFHRMRGFSLADVGAEAMRTLWLRGGFPRSYIAGTEKGSLRWRENFISTFLERDIQRLGISLPANTLRRFWTMVSHYHGQRMNYSELARSFGVSDMTVRRYLEILQGTYMLRMIQPWHSNTSKRLVKAPKVYLRDSGLFHALQHIEDMDQLLSHNKLGASWEGFALELVIGALGRAENDVYFWATHGGAELDLFWQQGGRNWGVELKWSDAPRLTKSMASALEDLGLEHLWVIYPGRDTYVLSEKVTALPLGSTGSPWRYGTRDTIGP